MPHITKANASEMGKRSAQRRKEQIEALVAKPLETDDTRRKARVLRQIDRLDVMIESTRDAELFIRLASAKERLWNLVFPKPGSLRPKAGRSERAPLAPIQPISETIQPQPVANQAALVVSENEQSHKSEIIQS